MTIPGLGPTLAAILVAELGDLAWFTKFSQFRKLAGLDIIWVTTGQWIGTARISTCGPPFPRWALYQAALGACRNPGWRARRAALIAKRQGDPYAFVKANTKLAANLLRIVWGVWRSGRPYVPAPVSMPAAHAARRGTPPSDKGQAEMGQPSGRQAGRFSCRRALPPKPRTRGRT